MAHRASNLLTQCYDALDGTAYTFPPQECEIESCDEWSRGFVTINGEDWLITIETRQHYELVLKEDEENII
jgi:hypothetical protein